MEKQAAGAVYETKTFLVAQERSEEEEGGAAEARWLVRLKSDGHPAGRVRLSRGMRPRVTVELSAPLRRTTEVEELLRLALLVLAPQAEALGLGAAEKDVCGRRELLEKYGFMPAGTDAAGEPYFERPVSRAFDARKGVAFCGLACCVCGENAWCAGCMQDGCAEREGCRHYVCCRGAGRQGCWTCSSFPCETDMFRKPRVRAFARYMAGHGAASLMEVLERNEKRGLMYHYPGKLVGDYDQFETEREILLFLEGTDAVFRRS